MAAHESWLWNDFASNPTESEAGLISSDSIAAFVFKELGSRDSDQGLSLVPETSLKENAEEA